MKCGDIDVLDVKNRKELRQWFIDNHSTAKNCWVVVEFGTPEDGKLHYIDAVEEALCFGWIDNTKKKTADGTNIQRLSPRKSGHWTELNKERCRRLIGLGLMTDDGMESMPDLDEPFVIDEDILAEFKDDKELWKRFNELPELYRRIKIDNIQSYDLEPGKRREKLDRFKESVSKGKIVGNWNDYGRLI